MRNTLLWNLLYHKQFGESSKELMLYEHVSLINFDINKSAIGFRFLIGFAVIALT